MLTNINPEPPIENLVTFADNGHGVVMQLFAPNMLGTVQFMFSYDKFAEFVPFVQKEYDRLIPLPLRQAMQIARELRG